MVGNNGATKTAKGLAAAAYEAIKQDIIRCRLEPGSRITKGRLIEHYGFGEAAVREALNRLSQEQLVRARPREGYEVAPVTLKQVHDLFETRLVIEPAVARIAAGRVDADRLRALDDAHRQHYLASTREGLERYAATNAAFHLEIARATGNDRLVKVMSGLIDEMERIMLLSYLHGPRSPNVETTHAELVVPLVAGDGEAAAEVMTRELLQHRAFVLNALLRVPSLQSVNLGGKAQERPLAPSTS